MTTITSLPEEMITNILSYNVITINDIINFRCVCKKFRYAATHEKFMERKLTQRWPNAKKEYNLKKLKTTNFQKIGLHYMKKFKNYLSRVMFEEYYDIISNNIIIDYKINKLIEFGNELDKRLNLYLRKTSIASRNKRIEFAFYADEIKYMLTQFSREPNCDLLKRYCNINKFHYMKICTIKIELDKLLLKPEREQFLEETVIFLTQYIQLRKDVSYSSIGKSLDKIAKEVLNCLRKKHPDHSIFSTSDETFSYWKNNNIDDNHWNEIESTQIMDVLQEYIFDKLNFRTCTRKVMPFDYLCIDYVLENKFGSEIIVFIIYQCVARRLGLRCDLIYVSFHVCISWKSQYITYGVLNERCFYIECKKFPNCLVDITWYYKYLVSKSDPSIYPIKSTKKMISWIRTLNRQFMQKFEIFSSGLVRVKWDMLPDYTLLYV